MKVQRCKGTRDLTPDEMRGFRFIEGVFRDSCLKWGYQEVKTPTLEYLHLFTSTGTLTPSRLGKVYSFLDWDGWSGERIVLKPDGTIPIARLYINTMEGKDPARLFYVSNVFVFEETGKESRERWQCGAELIGAGSTMADLELVALGMEALKGLGIKDLELRLSHAGLIRALLAKFGLSADEQAEIFDRILDGDLAALTQMNPVKPELSRALTLLLELKGKSSGFLKNMKALYSRDLPELEPSLNNFIDIVDGLEALGCNCQIDITSGRGFEYYTGVIFQIFAGGEQVGGGGRYDDLIPLLGGKDTPASGFALYMDKLMKKIKPEKLVKSRDRRVLITSRGSSLRLSREIFTLASQLHEAGYAAEVYLGGEKPAEVRWRLDVRAKKPMFVLTDRQKKEKTELKNAEEILAQLKR